MPTISSVNGEKKNIKCIGCALQKGIIQTQGGVVFEGKHFEIRQDYEIPVPGFFVLSSKRHIVGFADFNNEEKQEFIEVLWKLRKGMKEILKIKYIDLLFREDIIESKINPSHFHIALLPKQKWMNEFKSYGEIFAEAKKINNPANMKQIEIAVDKMKNYFSKF
ncbi:hypothetical protein JW756_01920 [Candidatus Woesearchaeota archaeon]|nr:hypothetical protein [Candidatus Woesearchaeota archaeon]